MNTYQGTYYGVASQTNTDDADNTMEKMTDYNPNVKTMTEELGMEVDNAQKTNQTDNEKINIDFDEPQCTHTQTLKQIFDDFDINTLGNWNELFDRVFTGFVRLDYKFGGFKPGDLSVIGIAPSFEVNMLVLNIIQNIIKTYGNNTCAYFCGSQTDYQRLLYRIATIVCGYENEKDSYYSPKYLNSVGEWYHDKEFPDKYVMPSFFLNVRPNMSLDNIEKWARDIAENKDIKCLFINSLQEICMAEQKGDDVMKRVCYRLKELAMDLNIAIVATSDIEHPTIKRREAPYSPAPFAIEEKYASLSDLGYNGVIEHIADTILIFVRPEYYQSENMHGESIKDKGIIYVEKSLWGGNEPVTLRIDATGKMCDWPPIKYIDKFPF